MHRAPDAGHQLRTMLAALPLLILCACDKPVVLGPGVFAPEPPRQQAIDATPLTSGDFLLQPRADFEITAKLLASKRYRFDELAAIAPWDFALGWGVASDEGALAGTRVTQGGRKMYWHLYDAPLSLDAIERHSANVHLIPASEEIHRQLSAVPRGAIVTLTGQLVDVTSPAGAFTPTSLTRTDTGAGACEILRVESFSVTSTP